MKSTPPKKYLYHLTYWDHLAFTNGSATYEADTKREAITELRQDIPGARVKVWLREKNPAFPAQRNTNQP